MQFLLAGRSFEFTDAIVRRKLERHVPEPVQEYWIDVDGTKWPVKQVMTIATGIDRRQFQSQNSRRLPQWIGFVVGAGATVIERGRGSGARQEARPVFNAAQLDVIDSVDVEIRFDWLRAGPSTMDSSGLPKYHHPARTEPRGVLSLKVILVAYASLLSMAATGAVSLVS